MERLVIAESIRTPAGIAGNAVLISDGVVLEVGDARDLRRPDLVEDRYPGSVIIPGLVDAHFHPVGYTASVTRLNVETASSHDELIEQIRAYATDRDPQLPIIGTRLNEVTMNERTLPHRGTLDRAVADRPVLVYRYDGHVAIANTAALAAAGITGATPDPTGGRIDRDDSGQATGVVKETAIDHITAVLGDRAADLEAEEVLSALRHLRSMGLTRLGAIASAGQGLFCGGSRELELLCELGRDLPIRLDVLVIADSPAELEAAAAMITAARAARLRFAGVKIFADGSFGGRTAAMHQPFEDRPTAGVSRLDEARDGSLARAALDMGGSVAIHAIGDRANRDVLHLYARLLDEGADPSRLRIEHASVVTDDDVARMGEMGIIASVQPAFLASEHAWIEGILGPERLHQTYRFRSLAEAGVQLAGGSDCPVEPPHPLAGMAAARHRFGIVPEEALDADQALALFTSDATRALRAPSALAPGSPADFSVLDADPVAIPDHDLTAVRVLSTWIDGDAG